MHRAASVKEDTNHNPSNVEETRLAPCREAGIARSRIFARPLYRVSQRARSRISAIHFRLIVGSLAIANATAALINSRDLPSRIAIKSIPRDGAFALSGEARRNGAF
jgi:hypothetical protein